MNSRDAHVEGPDLAALAGLLADGTRASFCLALLDGRAWTAIELARHAGVAASTATGHLNLLVTGGLLTQERQGRHRYVRLAGPDTAALIESLAAVAPRRAAPPRSLQAVNRHRALVRACLDRTERRPHLAGAVGAVVCRHAIDSGWITRVGATRAVAVTDAGRHALRDHLGLSDEILAPAR
jgi:DNA-binding transcriptional ArsR family regulator